MPICANARLTMNKCQVGAIEQPSKLFESLKTGKPCTTCQACREYQALNRRKNKKMRSVMFQKWTVKDFDTEREFKRFMEWFISLRIRRG